MSDSLILTIIIVAVVAVVGIGVIAFVTKGRKPKTPYTSERDADDLPSGQGADGTTDVASDTAGATDTAIAVEEPVSPAAPQLDVPEPVQGRLARLRARLTKSNNMFSKGLLALLSQDSIDEDVWDEIEENLLMADLGTEPAMELVDALRERVKIEGSKDPARVKAMLREELLKLVDPSLDRSYLPEPHPDRPSIIMVVGVNGVGKTTTIGKMARVLVAEDKDVLLGAADTFRAAAAEQLATWGDRVGVPTVRSDIDGADPASVAFEAVSAGIDQEVDIVMIDTAGRLQNKVGLMDELGKIKRVVEKKATIDEVL
ncbi:MAG: signal recognition particle receptor subunit alpha, partial [Glutamicibacter ardleyensis]